MSELTVLTSPMGTMGKQQRRRCTLPKISTFTRLTVLATLIACLCLCTGPTVAITVRDTVPVSGVPTQPSSADHHSKSEPSAETEVIPSDSLACPVERPFLLERSPSSLQLYLLNAAGLHRIQIDGLGISQPHVCKLPKRYDDALALQVLDVELGGKQYVLFVVTTDQWHNVYMAYGQLATPEGPSGPPQTGQPVQRIKYSGTSSRARLLECNGNIYLVTIVTYANMGKIRVYRWVQSYFSLESTKEMSSIDDVECHCPSTLLLLVLDYAPLPERSLAHVLLLDAAGQPVKVQEMFFLAQPLHSFSLAGKLYLIRHVSRDVTFLYQWDAEAKFVRLRKLPFRPGQLATLTHWDSTLAIANDGGTVRLFGGGQQQLLRIESPFTVRSARQSAATTQLAATTPAVDGRLRRLFGLRTDSENEVGLAAEFACSPTESANGTAVKIFQLTVMSVARTAEAQEQGFRALSGCLERLKDATNERKHWIDLIRAQLTRKNLVLDSLAQLGAAGLSTLLHPSTALAAVTVPFESPSSLLPPTRTALNGQALLLRHYRTATDLNQVLLLNRERTEIRGDLHVAGDVRTRHSKIRAVHPLEPETADLARRSKRNTGTPARSTFYALKAREVISDVALSRRFVRKSKMNVLPGTVQVDALHAGAVQLGQGQINHLPVPNRKELMEAATRGYRGHKVFRSVRSYRLTAQRFNGEPLDPHIIQAGLRSTSDGITIRTDVCRSWNLLVRGTLNGLRLQQYAATAYQPVLRVKGNVRLSGPVCTKNLQYRQTLNGAVPGELLDRISNQTIAGPVIVSKGFTHSLLVQHVNGEPLASYASTAAHRTNSLLTKSPVRTGQMVVLGDLIADHAEQQFAPHIGTRTGDFRQLYRGKLLLNGSLRLKVATIHAANVTLLDRSVSSKPYQQYLLRSERQVLEQAAGAPYRSAHFQYLFANTLNGAPLWQFSLVHRSWQNSLYLQDALVRGPVRPASLSKRLHSIRRNRVDLSARVSVCSLRHFVGTLRVAHLRTRSLGGAFDPQVLWRRQRDPAPPAASKALLGHTTLHGTTVRVRGSLRAHHLNARTAFEVAELAKPATTRPKRGLHFRALQMATVEAATTLVLRQATVGDDLLPLGSFVPRFGAARSAHDGGGPVPRFARIVTPDAPQHIAAASVARINLCAVDRLLQDTVPRFAGPHAIEGTKRVRGSITVTGQLRTTTVNGLAAALLERAVTRGSAIPQSIEARWRFGSLAAGYLTAKVLNRGALARLALRTDAALLLQSELFIDRLQVTELQWPERAGVSFGDPAQPLAPAEVALLRCYGSIHGRYHNPSHLLHELLLAPSPDTHHFVEELLIFDTPHVHFGNSSAVPAGPSASIERIARRCLRRRPQPQPQPQPQAPPVVFEHAQVLLTPDATVVRGSLLATEHARLTAGSCGGIDVHGRLGPAADVFRLATGPPPSPIGGRKRFLRFGSARNVTLDSRNPPAFWHRLAFCSHPPEPVCAGLRLHFGPAVPATVSRLLTAVHLNRVPLDGFFHAFVKRRAPPLGPHSKLQHIQDLLDVLTVADLQLVGFDTILHHINGIALGELVQRATANATHQTVTGPKHFRALRLGGPLSLQQLNGAGLAWLKRAILAPVAERTPVALEAAVFDRPVELAELHTRTLYHSRTGSASLLPAGPHSRQWQPDPFATMELRAPSYTPAGQGENVASAVAAAARPGAVRLPGDGGAVRVGCSDDQRSLVVALTTRRHPGANRTEEQRLHELSILPSAIPAEASGCREVIGAAPLSGTASSLLIVVRGRGGQPAAYRYDVARGLVQSIPLPPALTGNPAGACHQQLQLLRPRLGPDRDLMLASAGCTSAAPAASPAAVTLGRMVQIFRLDGDSTAGAMPQFRHFQTIATAGSVSALNSTADSTALLLQIATTKHRHQYVYNSIEGWTRSDVLP